ALVVGASTASAQINEYYLGVFSNEGNTIKFTIGAYPHSISQSKRTDGTFYTAMRVAIINNEKAAPIIWSDYKIYILLKDGSLFYNFLTNASAESDFGCKYTVAPGTTHIQLFCFEKLFTNSEIDKVWLSLGDNKFLPLVSYIDNKNIPADTLQTPSPLKK
ncbi:MAG: hypothetical protein H7259_03310, partial [Cytophagales bacterium]|nr:hypothetical protein [Cytophaga sp.]